MQEGLIELLDERCLYFEATIHLDDVSRTCGREPATTGSSAQKEGIPQPLGPDESVGCPSHGPLEEGRQRERQGNVVENPHNGDIVATVLSDGDRLVRKILAALE
jgi:hypothetical protein